MKKTLYIIIATSLLAVSCLKEAPVSNPEGGNTVTLSAYMEQGSNKTHTSESGEFSWSVSDAISVMTTSDWAKLTYAGATASASGDFTGVINKDDKLTGYAIYPYNPLGYEMTNEHTLIFNLPEKMEWKEDAVSSPMAAAISEEGDIQFKHLNGLLRVVYKNVGPDATSFVVESENEPIAGQFKVDLSASAPVLVADGADGKKVEFTFLNTAIVEKMVFYVPLPAATYSKLTMYLSDGTEAIAASKKVIANNADNVLEVSRAEMLNTPDFDAPAPGVITIDAAAATQEITFESVEMTFTAALALNDAELPEGVSATAGVQNGEGLVQEYNSSNNTEYLLLPEGSYELSALTFAAGNLQAEGTITLKREGLVSDKEYLLPLTITSTNKKNVVTAPVIKYIKVTNPKYCYQECDRSGWKIAFCNAEDRSSTYWAKNMLDNNLKTNWASYWNAAKQTVIGENVDDFRYPVENSYPGTIVYTYGNRLDNTTINVEYPCCDGIRHFTKTVVVVDMGEEVALHSLGVAKMAGSDGNLDLKQMNVDIESQFTLHTASEYEEGTDVFRAAIANYDTANEGNNWQRILSWSGIPKGTVAAGLAPLYKQIDDSVIGTETGKGRYLKLTFQESWRTANCMEIAELYGRRLVSVDGKAIE